MCDLYLVFRRLCFQGLPDVCNDVVRGFDAYRDAHQVGRDTGGTQLVIAHLAGGAAGRVQAAGFHIRHVGGDTGQFQPLHEVFRRLASPLDAKADHAAAAIRQQLLCQRVTGVARQAGVFDPGHLGVCAQELRHRKAILAVALHAQVQALQPQIEQVRVLGDWMAPKSRISWATALVM